MDQVLYWNAVALESDRMAHTDIRPGEGGVRGAVGSSRALGIVQLAVHDAYFGIAGAEHGCWLDEPPVAAEGASVDAAMAVAAHTTLTALYPGQTARLDRALREAGVHGPGTGRGCAFGQAVGRAVLKARAADPALTDEGYVPDPVAPGHRADPMEPEQGCYAPHYGARSHCFAVTSRYTLDSPPKTSDPRYLAALREVRAKGIATAAAATLPPGFRTRTPAETLAAIFWAYDAARCIGTPPRLYNQIVREIATARGNSVAQNARLFALVNAAQADAAILCWDEKYRHNLWRPVLGIREHDPATGPQATPGQDLDLDADCDPFWEPHGAPRSNDVAANSTPAFPAYPSGHAALGAAAFQVTRRFYGVHADGPDTLTDGIGFISDELDGVSTDNRGAIRTRHSRVFPGGLWQMIEENGQSRVFLGVHWSFDAYATDARGDMDLSQNIGGVRLGRDIANDLWANGLRQGAAAGARQLG
ncbi:hypothetical protein JK358_13975 [Nocardia sp. 2]|uniref:Vanadium chloroperoxidase N-terminal domain-containing protein n=1 Tax=Nocardia acididurans TaxID=2802282 RepID=A0ABS1M8M4_9NOCA|nr:vanadium-dependent haloperoxidase [Nocardia acididurans]MBL1075503.1 hypothetical protein [Nocardia acididurans]